ncbi:MAG: CoA transferase [Chloroflexi bacterium]|nr:CoA transferase [Chloroflexota bacterium]
MSSPLEGVKVIDISQMYGGPGAAMYLADQGADVIKVEPLEGDSSRRLHTSPLWHGQSRPFAVFNRNKRGIALDIKKDAASSVVRKLIQWADVLIVNFRLGDDRKLGLDYDSVRSINPKTIYASLTAYGEKGPYAHLKGYSLAMEARAGILAARTTSDGTPIAPPIMVTDMAAAIFLAYCVTLAILERQKTGMGTKIETSLLEMAIAMQAFQLVRLEGDSLPLMPGANPMYTPYRCKDGKFIIAIVLTDEDWIKFCRVADLEHLGRDPDLSTYMKRLRRAEELFPVLEAIFATKTSKEWLHLLEENDLVCSPIMSRAETMDDPHVLTNKMLVDVEQPGVGMIRMMGALVRFSNITQNPIRPAPSLGQHTEEILREMNYTNSEIQRLKDEKVILAG